MLDFPGEQADGSLYSSGSRGTSWEARIILQMMEAVGCLSGGAEHECWGDWKNYQWLEFGSCVARFLTSYSRME